jgi:hypothetical protein
MKISPPAFPTYLADNMAHGMSLRDYFAAAAMHCYLLESMNDTERDSEPLWIAGLAYEMADAMLEAREQ